MATSIFAQSSTSSSVLVIWKGEQKMRDSARLINCYCGSCFSSVHTHLCDICGRRLEHNKLRRHAVTGQSLLKQPWTVQCRRRACLFDRAPLSATDNHCDVVIVLGKNVLQVNKLHTGSSWTISCSDTLYSCNIDLPFLPASLPTSIRLLPSSHRTTVTAL